MSQLALSAVLPYLQALAAAVVPIVGTLFLTWLRMRQQNTVLDAAFARAGAEAYKQIATSGRSITDPEVIARAVEAGGLYLLDRVPDTLRARGVTPEGAAQIVGAELGKLLAADPSVRVTN